MEILPPLQACPQVPTGARNSRRWSPAPNASPPRRPRAFDRQQGLPTGKKLTGAVRITERQRRANSGMPLVRQVLEQFADVALEQLAELIDGAEFDALGRFVVQGGNGGS